MGALQRRSLSFDAALKSYETIINRYPESALIDKMLFLTGDLYEKDFKDPKKAAGFYERILVEFPNSMYVNEARKRLREMKGENAL
jgi:outer membrane protein assembly factor BamD (BamD/ComL family)